MPVRSSGKTALLPARPSSSSEVRQSHPARSPGAAGQFVYVLANPLAGRGRARVIADAILQAIASSGRHAALWVEPPELAIPDRRPDAVVVIGGDGTLRAAVQRLITLYDVDAPPLLPVPLGTANLIGQYLGLQRSVAEIALEGARHLVESSGVLRGLGAPESEIARQQALRAVQALDQMRIARIDAGLANDQLFLVMAGVGFDAHVVHELARRRSGPIGLSSYALPAAAAVTRYSFAPLRVDVDGGRAFGWRPGVVMIANLPQYGTGFPIVPGARPDDGLLDVLCLPCDSRMRLLELLVLAADQRHLSVEGAVQVRGREVFVEAQTSVPVQIDGDPGGTLPLRVRLSPQRVSLIRP